MTQAFEFDVFLSHSSQDKPAVRALAQRLKQDGVRVWLDEWEIQIGDSIFSMIEHGLEHSRLLLFFMSQAAFTSDWATLEHQTIRFRDPLNKTRRFIPIRLDDTEARGSLVQFAYMDWRTPSEAAYQQLKALCLTPAPASPPRHTALPDIADFATFAQTWPHQRNNVQLAFVSPKHHPISTAQADANPAWCSDFILRIQTQKPGHLALFTQDNALTVHQCYPNTLQGAGTLPAREYFVPGELLKLPSPTLGSQVKRLYFQTPGTEFALAFLCDTLPPCITPVNPLQAINKQTMHTILQALLQDKNASLAHALIEVTPK